MPHTPPLFVCSRILAQRQAFINHTACMSCMFRTLSFSFMQCVESEEGTRRTKTTYRIVIQGENL